MHKEPGELRNIDKCRKFSYNKTVILITRCVRGGISMPVAIAATKTNVTVCEVTTKKELRLFVDYPNKLYRDVPQFVPAFYGDDLEDWDKKKNPAFS